MAGQIMITFEDGTTDHYEASKLLDSKALKGVFGITTNFVDTPGYLTLDQLKKMHDKGHAIVNYSSNHWKLGQDQQRPYITPHTPQEITQDALAGRDFLNSNGLDGDYYIAPFGTLNVAGDLHLTELFGYFKWIRLTRGMNVENKWSYDDLNATFRPAYHSSKIKEKKVVVGVTEPGDIRREKGVRLVADQAVVTDTLCVISYHLVNHILGEEHNITWRQFQSDIKHIRDLIDEKGLVCITPKDMLLNE